ncbi:nucleotidyltransferase domain-containing protein [Streptomyces sp. NPDC020965]|uniref:nucleotidyltransferase domain-containing protein n=1 Tax=Streptomyces sp. NPDC020965 TaxID=3365105 RepID=UPI00378F61B0
MTDEVTLQLLDRFVGDVRDLLSPLSVWAHGSLGGGDYRPGRSDLDLIAVLAQPCTHAERERLGGLHRRLTADLPLASRLHCGYLVAAEADDTDRAHLTWAHEELSERPVSPVTRRELHEFGVVLYGRPPAGVLPPVTDRRLTEHVLRDLGGYWRPLVDRPELWLADIWVDLGLLTLARATVTLRTGALITKAAALDVLAGELGAPAEVVADIRRRRYGDPEPATPEWLARRAELTTAFLGPAIDRTVRDGR